MRLEKDHHIRELGPIRVSLRDDLVFTPQSFRGDTCYTIEDPVGSKFYRIGLAEYTFISLLDGQTTISEALALSARARPECALSETDAAAICQWLVEMNLASTEESSHPRRLRDQADRTGVQAAWQRWNPALLRFPLFHPDRFFDSVTPWLRPLYSAPAHAVWVVALAIASYQIAAHWDRFSTSAQGVFAPHNWLWLTLCWLVLKVLHELSHGTVCKMYGGTVRETGILFFMMVAPVAYVDVTSSWRFRSKWQRIHTAAAGVYAEICVASLAALVWSRTDPGPLNAFCFNTVIMAGFTTVLFNANPLMKYDGYFILSDLLEIPNLYASGQFCLQRWAKRYLLGVQTTLPAWPRWKHRAIGWYGTASLVWRVVFCAGILVVASTYLYGAGIVLSLLAGITWLGLPAVRFIRYLMTGTPTEKPNRLRFMGTTGLATVLGGGILAVVPWPAATQAPAVVEFAAPAVVRTDSAGFVREVHVQPGQYVAEGEMLTVLENKQLEQELADILLAQQQSRLKLRTHEKNKQMAAYQAELENLESLEKKRLEKQSQVDHLTLYAPSSGTVIARNLEELIGQYLKPGTEVVSIGDERLKELRLSIAQEDVDVFGAHVGRPVRVRIPGSTIVCPLSELGPRASLVPPHLALCAPFGGSLPVRAVTGDGPQGSDKKYELLGPRFQGTVPLPPDRSSNLRIGQRASVTLRSSDNTVGRFLYHSLCRWVRARTTESR